MASSKQSKKLLETVVTKLQDVIENGEVQIVEGKNGPEEVRKTASPAFYTAAVSVLKLVGEDGSADAPTIASRLKELSLPFSIQGDELVERDDFQH